MLIICRKYRDAILSASIVNAKRTVDIMVMDIVTIYWRNMTQI